MKMLILGGTGFLGPHIVNAAVKNGHTVTLFNRGKTNPHLFPDLEKLRGDRDGNLKALEGRKWDWVVDTSAYFPRVVTDSATLLAPNVRQYLFVSSISVYPDLEKDVDESTPVGTIEDETTEKITSESYGPLKALCEQAAERAMPDRVTNVRPGLIVGYRDRSDRFTYWPVRIAKGGEVLAPDDPKLPVRIIDVHDLGRWCVQMLEDGHVGVYNAVGPYGSDGSLTMEELLHGSKVVSGSNATFTWADGDFLQENGVQPWMGLPLWVPGGGGKVDCEKAISQGLTFRPVATTIQRTLDWEAERPKDHRWRAGITMEKEKEVLAKWHARKKREIFVYHRNVEK